MDTLIIGGGAAGLMAACFSPGKTVVLEHRSSPGRKLLATGGGRCNLTHAADAVGIASAFGRHVRFLLPALHGFPPDRIRRFFADLGVPSHADPDGCVFPDSQRAGDLLAALQRSAKANGAEIRCGVRALHLVPEQRPPDSAGQPVQRIIAVETTQGRYTPRRVILATGGQSYPELGSDGSGFDFARALGLPVEKPLPGLAGLWTAASWPHALSGLLCENGALRLDLPGTPSDVRSGPILFTHRGISGPPALALAGEINVLLQSMATVPLRICFIHGRSVAQWMDLFTGWRQTKGGRATHNLLSGELPRTLAMMLCTQCGLADTAIARAAKTSLQSLAILCADAPLQITGTEGWSRAMITRGGISIAALNPKTLACLSIPNLFCAGEVVDVDGPCGGFNLTWAFASARLAALSKE